jgi:hypothetical protein
VPKRTREPDFAAEFVHSEFERALEEETEYQHKNRGRRIKQKTDQLCRQVQRALNLALAGQFSADILDGVFVIGVSAAGGSGHLIAHVSVPQERSVGAVLAELRERAPVLRAIVAGYISRKRAPELSFVPVPPGDHHYD